MNRIRKICLLMLLTILLSSCSMKELKVSNTIKQPERVVSPIYGSWKLLYYIDKDGNKEDVTSEVRNNALFNDELIIVGDIYSENASYSTKNVSGEDYFLYRYKMSKKDVGINKDRLEVVSIYSDDQFILEIIILDEDKIMVYKDSRFMVYNKEEDEIDKKEIEVYINNEKSYTGLSRIKDLSNEAYNLGFIIGLKKESEIDGIKNWDYRTIYFKFNTDKSISAYELSDIFLPRKTGFYDLEVIRKDNKDTSYDIIRLEAKDEEKKLQLKDTKYLKNILYVGNDYISIENQGKNINKFFRVYPLDYLNENKNLILSEALDGETLSRVRQDISLNESKNIGENFDEKNFALTRRSGYWTLVGRVDYMQDKKDKTEEYNIRAITPKSLVNYDELSIPWTYIKNKIPNLIDAFTSPSGDILVARTYDSIKVFKIENNKILNEPIYKLDIDNGESIIMNEWATGIYSDLWEKEVIKNKGVELVD